MYYDWYNRFEWFWEFSVFEFENNIIGSLFFIPFLYASVIFWWRGSLIVWILCVAIMIPRILQYSFNLTQLITNIVLAFVPLITVMFFVFILRWIARQKEIIETREKERHFYMSQVLKAQEEERKRIAQELHDDTTQGLLTIANRTQEIMSSIDTQSKFTTKERLIWIRDTALGMSDDVRRLSLDLRPRILDTMGLMSALRWLTQRLNEENQIDVKFMITGKPTPLNPQTEVTIFRIVQEALSNIKHHSKAKEALVHLKYAPEFLEIKIRDNGKGFSLNNKLKNPAPNTRLGIIGMKERSALINGSCNIWSRHGKGTIVTIKILHPVISSKHQSK